MAGERRTMGGVEEEEEGRERGPATADDGSVLRSNRGRATPNQLVETDSTTTKPPFNESIQAEPHPRRRSTTDLAASFPDRRLDPDVQRCRRRGRDQTASPN